jgi:hypothetical protein
MILGRTNNKILSEIFIKRIYAKGKVNAKDLADWIIEKINKILKPIKDKKCECANCGHSKKETYWTIKPEEREKYNKKIQQYGLTQHFGDDNYCILLESLTKIIHHHFKNGIIEPIKETDQEKETIDQWLLPDGKINENYYDWDEFDKLRWTFTKGSRKRYQDNTIKHN